MSPRRFKQPVMAERPERPCGANTVALEEKHKALLIQEQQLSRRLCAQIQNMDALKFVMQTCTGDLNRLSGKLWAFLNMAEKRIAVRERRPDSEKVRDELQDALELEVQKVGAAHALLAELISKSKDKQAAAEKAVDVMNDQKLTLPLDRTDFPTNFLSKMQHLEGESQKFVTKVAEKMRELDATVAIAAKRTATAMKKCYAELKQLKNHLEEECEETKSAIENAQKAVEKWQDKINDYRSRPENQFKAGDDEGLDAASFHKRAKLKGPALDKLRSTVKGACYTGTGGRQLDVIFSRADRDGSGELDEDEIRKVMRCTLKIPHTVIADCEVAALCESLDADESGAVNIKELVAFLNADLDVDGLEEQKNKMQNVVEQLLEAQKSLEEDLKNKRKAWLVDRDCMQITTASGLELDSHMSNKKNAGLKGPKRRKPLEPRMVDKVRERLQKAAQGREIGELLGQFDRDGSGQLEEIEVRRALRDSLKIPKYAISDPEISSLCALLDADGSGSVSIQELIEFIGEEREPEETPEALRMVEGRLKKGMRQGAPIKGKQRGAASDASTQASSAASGYNAK